MYEVNYKKHEAESILEALVTGRLDFKAAIAISSESRAKAHNLGFHLFKDLSRVELDGGIIQIMEFFDENKNQKLKIAHKNVTGALFVNGEQLDFWKFWETVASNNGLTSKIFLNKNDAFSWLQNKSEAKQK